MRYVEQYLLEELLLHQRRGRFERVDLSLRHRRVESTGGSALLLTSSSRLLLCAASAFVVVDGRRGNGREPYVAVRLVQRVHPLGNLEQYLLTVVQMQHTALLGLRLEVAVAVARRLGSGLGFDLGSGSGSGSEPGLGLTSFSNSLSARYV